MAAPESKFNPFNPHAEVQLYRRHLPHWRQAGATYFVTFRLADSIPKNILLQWREQRNLWLKAHGITNGLSEDEKARRYAAVLQQTLVHFHNQRSWIGDFVIMPNHVHLLIQPFDKHPLEEWLQSVKSYAARRFDKHTMVDGKVFQQESYDRIVRNREELAAYRKYIEANGIKANLPKSEYLHHRCDWL